MAVELMQQGVSAARSLPADYIPTKRLNTKAACEHLGISRSALESRVKMGVVVRRYDGAGKPYFLLGELDGVKMRNVKV